MFHLFGLQENLKTVLLLAKPYAEGEVRNQDLLKAAYLRFLQAKQPLSLVPCSRKLEFVQDNSLSLQLAKLFGAKTSLDDMDQHLAIDLNENINRTSKMNHLKNIFEQIEQKNNDFASLFRLVINFVFFADSKLAGGGSTSNAMGVIWANDRSNWAFQDFYEFFIHEATHNLLFLDERRFHHYINYDLVRPVENYAYSAILARPRPIDKVIHSLVVATEICVAREMKLGHPPKPKLHPPTDIILENCFKTIESLKKLEDKVSILTPRGIELVKHCQNALINIKPQQVQHYAFG